MLKRFLTYPFYFIMFPTGVPISSCNLIASTSRSSNVFRKNVKKSKKPKVTQLKPADCPWKKTTLMVARRHNSLDMTLGEIFRSRMNDLHYRYYVNKISLDI